MKKILLIIAFASFTLSSFAQTIGQSELKEIQSSFEDNETNVGLQNIIIGESNLKDMALNSQLQGKIDHFFKYKVDVSGITDQHSSGRCWMFTSLNVLRPGIMKELNVSNFQFSHNYSYFWDVFEKSNLFLENIIATADRPMDDREVVVFFRSPFGDGGVWNLFYNIGEKYGVVPQEVMPETAHSESTSQMRSIINERLRVGGYNIREMHADGAKKSEIQDEKLTILKDVYRVLALCLGEPPTEFTWRYKTKDGEVKSLTSTPKEFYEMIITDDYNPSDYVMVMNDPTREYYKVYEIKNYKNTIEGINWIYLNLPNEELKKAAMASIKGNEAMYASCDVGKQYNGKAGISDPEMYDYESLLGIDLAMDKKARILTRQSGSSHAMALIAVDTDENDNPIKWEFENSWGASAGNKGYITFTDDWFEEYMFRLVINKRYLSQKAISALKAKPIMLPIWDYMN